MNYAAPLKDMMFVIRELAGLEDVRRLPGLEEANDDTVQAVLEEAARFNAEVVAPLNRVGDEQPSSVADGVVTTAPGFREAFRLFAESGWQGVQHPARFGGQGLPKLVGTACNEMLNSANLSFALCPLLYVAPEASDPHDGVRYADVLAELGRQGVVELYRGHKVAYQYTEFASIESHIVVQAFESIS